MTTAKQLALTLALTLFALLANLQAQTPRVSTVNVKAESDRVHISSEGDIVELRLEVVSESGDVVFESGAITGNTLDWKMTDAQGERVAPGTYLVTVTHRNAAGKMKKRVEQVTVDEAEKADKQPTAAPQAVQAAITGAGTTGKIAKFTGAATIANSIITESAGKIGIGNAAPKHTLSILTGPTCTTNGWGGAIELGDATAIGWRRNSQNWRFGMGHTSDGFSMFRTLADPGSQTTSGAIYDFFIGNNGIVGIGTITPSWGKLHVESNSTGAAVYGKSQRAAGVYGQSTSNTGVVGISNSGDGVFGSSGYGYAGHFYGRVKVTSNLEVNNCTGCTTTPSDQNLKANFSTINSRIILDRLSAIPIKAWNYKNDEPSVRHIGPMAQDFRTAFNLGVDDKHIDLIDANGVTMASIQALYQMMQEKDRQIEQQELKNKAQSRQIEQLQVQLDRVKRTIKKKRTARR